MKDLKERLRVINHFRETLQSDRVFYKGKDVPIRSFCYTS